MKISGIYKIVNIKNGKFYLGSSNDIKNRWKRHKWMLRHNKHHSIHLQRAWNKYGEINFVFKIIKTLPESILFKNEQKYLNKLKPYKNGYNISKFTEGGDLISYHPNINDIKEKQRILTQNRWNNKTEEEKLAYAEKIKGKNNPNWRGGKSYFTCPVCGCTIKKHNKNQLCCSKCRKRTGVDNPFYGRKHSKKTIIKFKKIRKKYGNKFNTQKIKVEVNGIIYNSFSEAAKNNNCAVASIRNRLNNPTKFPNYKLVTQQ